LWALEGIGRCYLALNNQAAARRAYVAAADAADKVRAQFRSEEFKTGLFGDMQQIFERALALSMEAGDGEAGWTLSEASRSRALLDVVRERVPVGNTAPGSSLSTEPVPLDKVRATLRAGEAIVEYHSLKDRLYAWVIRPGGIQAFTIEQPRAKLDKIVDQFRHSIFDRKPESKELGQRLYKMLVQPLHLAPNERLLIVPHGGLHYMPFQALYDGNHYLIEDHPLAVAPSASVAIQLLNEDKAVSPKLVAFGNPANEAKYALPGSEREVEKIGTLFQDKKLFLQKQASREMFRDEAGSGRILHVAAHAEVDEIDPLASRILLAREGKDPGFLEAREIYGLKLNDVSLVTISACESGLGRIARGDEILGFTRSFLTAGASGLIVSLWPVSDNSTELLMTTLYGELAKGAEAIDAMQAAQITVLKRGRYSHPFFWAPFNFMGDWRMHVRG
jgi:CHAT domain-containing protein